MDTPAESRPDLCAPASSQRSDGRREATTADTGSRSRCEHALAAVVLGLDPDATVATINVNVRDDITRADMRQLSTQVGGAIGAPDAPGVIRNLQRVRSLPFVVAATLGLLAALSLAHQLLMSARNRRRDVAILGALGADRRWLSWVVHWQATLTAVVALLLAVPFGFAVGRLIYLAFIDRVGSDNSVTLPLWMIAMTIVVTVALANLVATPSVRRVRRLPLARYLGDG